MALLHDPARAAETRSVLAHGAGRVSEEINPVWVALIEEKDKQPPETLVLLREQFGGSNWQQLPAVPTRTLAITSHSTELVMLLENRTWAWFSGSSVSSRFSYGPALPDRARILDLAGDRKSLWALGRFSPAATQPASTQPTTTPAESSAESVRIYSLAGSSWKTWPAELPEGQGARPLNVSLALIAEQPHVAVSSGDQYVRLHKFDPNAQTWSEVTSFRLDAAPRQVKLLNSKERPVLWIQTGEGVGLLRSGDRSTPLTLAGPAPSPQDLDLTVVGDQFRLYFRRDAKLYEQRYTSEGAADGEPALVSWTRPQIQPPIHWLTAVMAVMAVLLISSLLRRRNAARDQDQRQDEDDDT